MVISGALVFHKHILFQLLEGYGQTECAAAATTTVSGTFDAGKLAHL